MRRFLISAGIKLLIASLFLCGAYYIVNHSNFYYLFIPNIFLLIGLAFLFEAIFSLLFSLSKKLAKQKTGIFGTSRSTFIVLFIADVIIRLTGVMQTYTERSDGIYFSTAANEKLDSWYWVYQPNAFITNQKKEFLFERQANSIGISEKELPKEKGSKFRILAIGDSFTEGVGVSYEDTWVKQMETRWKSHNVETINAGIGGSDPVYAYALYRDKLVDYNPDVVILTINSTDLTDIIGRGGFERFHLDGTAGKGSPSWEWVYASNHLFRMVMRTVFDYNSDLIRNSDTPETNEKAITILKEALTRLKNRCSEKNTELLVVLQPSLKEFPNGKHTPFYGQAELANFMKMEKINYLDVSSAFQKKGKSVTDYYYPLDTHFNKKGYALFGDAVCDKVEEIGFLE